MSRPPDTVAAPPATAARAIGGAQLPSLTGMRWIAAFLVFCFHVTKYQYLGGRFGRIMGWLFGQGFVGVSFFFILSGFVLAWSARDGDGPVLFWRRRIARVYPVHVVTALLALVLGLVLPGLVTSRPVRAAVANLFLVSTWKPQWWQVLNPVSWSLACEAFFYATFPLLAWGLRRLTARWVYAVAGLALAAVILLAYVQQNHGLPFDLNTFPPARLPEFVLGVALGRLVRMGAWRGPGLDLAVAVTVVGYFLTTVVAHSYSIAACTAVGFGLLVPAAAVADLNGTPSSWRHPRLVRLGELSFAFYMIHVLVMRTGDRIYGARLHLPPLQGLALSTGVCLVALGLAWVLYEFVEVPGRRLILRPSRRRRTRDAAPAPEPASSTTGPTATS